MLERLLEAPIPAWLFGVMVLVFLVLAVLSKRAIDGWAKAFARICELENRLTQHLFQSIRTERVCRTCSPHPPPPPPPPPNIRITEGTPPAPPPPSAPDRTENP